MTSDPWFVSEGRLDGKRALLRAREFLPAEVSPATHSKLLTITWAYDGDPINGMPSVSDSRAMETFEERLVTGLERDLVCVLFAVLTTNSVRTWKLYCRDVDAAQAAIDRVFSADEGLPIDICLAHDPSWNELMALSRAAVPKPS